MELLAQGAEAKIFLHNKTILKERQVKRYRLEIIDEKIRRQRTRSEVKILQKASDIIPVPKIINTDEKSKITLEYLDGKKLRDIFDIVTTKQRRKYAKEIGKNIALLHNQNIIHQDLTTSNMIIKEEKLYFIDFGLSFISLKAEDKAVDLFLLYKALEAKHTNHARKAWNEIIKEYENKSQDAKEILLRLEKVQKRGRYKQQKV